MTLLNTTHKDRESAARSIAANRASKVQLIAENGLNNTARVNAMNLAVDVCDYIATENPSEATMRQLARTVAIARDAAEAGEDSTKWDYGDGLDRIPDTSDPGIYGDCV